VIFAQGPLTQMETFLKINAQDKHIMIRSITPRFSELEGLGVIRPVGEKTCEVTGRNILLWDVTDKLPHKVKEEKKKTPQDLIDGLTLLVNKVVSYLEFKREFDLANKIKLHLQEILK